MLMNNSNWYLVIIDVIAQLGPALYLGVFGPRVVTVTVIYDKAFLAHE